MTPCSCGFCQVFPCMLKNSFSTMQDEALAELEEAKEALDDAQAIFAAVNAKAQEQVPETQPDKGKQPVRGRSRLCKRPPSKGKDTAQKPLMTQHGDLFSHDEAPYSAELSVALSCVADWAGARHSFLLHFVFGKRYRHAGILSCR